jgi:hypothetical protein
MESPLTLMGLGMPVLQAQRVGQAVVPLTGVGTAQAGGTAISDLADIVLGTTAASQTAFVLPAASSPGHELTFYNLTSTTALIFPDLGGTIDAGSVNASVNVTGVPAARRFIKTASLTWISMLTA